jgi:hypothetical protein
MDQRAAEGLLGQWLAHRDGRGTPPGTPLPQASDDEVEAHFAADLAEPHVAPEAPAPEPQPRAEHEAEPARHALQAAGAVLEAFAAGTLGTQGRTGASRPGAPAEAHGAAPDAAPETVTDVAPDVAPVEAGTAGTPPIEPVAGPALGDSAAAAVLAAQRPPVEPLHPVEPVEAVDVDGATGADRADKPAFPAATTAVTAPATPSTSTSAVAGEPPEAAAAPASPVPYEIDFRPRAGARTVVGLLVLAGLAATGLACWRAYQDRTTVSVGIAATVGLLTGILWAVRAGSSVSRLRLVGSRLELVRDGTRLVFDLADPHTAVEVVGTPGRRGWKVVFPRRNMSPVVVDASMVDPHELTRAVEFHRGAHLRAPAGR